ncbi:MAG: hypothetical protein LBT21_07385 [Oscillospiraceae bacterium]|jgi:hypothetical protein|nr:hypothetical protein [Oscillospiraceae bacterium]
MKIISKIKKNDCLSVSPLIETDNNAEIKIKQNEQCQKIHIVKLAEYQEENRETKIGPVWFHDESNLNPLTWPQNFSMPEAIEWDVFFIGDKVIFWSPLFVTLFSSKPKVSPGIASAGCYAAKDIVAIKVSVQNGIFIIAKESFYQNVAVNIQDSPSTLREVAAALALMLSGKLSEEQFARLSAFNFVDSGELILIIGE